MRDRQLFEEYLLSNGMRLYHYGGDFPISSFRFQFPVGSAYATSDNGFIPGEPHFLEHMLMNRSEKWPGAKELTRLLGMKAGDDNAATYPHHTIYMLDIPAQYAELAIDSLIDRTFHPVFAEEDVIRERGVIRNERSKMDKFFPGISHSSKYYNTEVIHDTLMRPEQRLGADADIEQITVETLWKAWDASIVTEGAVVISVGPHDVEMVKQKIETLPRKAGRQFKSHIEQAYWVRPEFHTAEFENVSEPSLEVLWLRERPSLEEWVGVSFVMRLMVNSVQGVLYEELRRQKGWAYHMDWNTSLYIDQCRYGFYFPLNNLEEIEYTRGVLLERIQEGLASQILIKREIERRIAARAHTYQTATAIMGGASEDLRTYGRIYTEKEIEGAIQKMASPEWRHHIQKTFFTRESFGETAFFPAKT